MPEQDRQRATRLRERIPDQGDGDLGQDPGDDDDRADDNPDRHHRVAQQDREQHAEDGLADDRRTDDEEDGQPGGFDEDVVAEHPRDVLQAGERVVARARADKGQVGEADVKGVQHRSQEQPPEQCEAGREHEQARPLKPFPV